MMSPLTNIQLEFEETDAVFSADMRLKIENVFKQGIAQISALLPIENIKIIVRSGKYVIPETGIGGYNPAPDTILMTVDLENQNLLKNFDTEFVATMGHEMHHALRRRHQGFGETLADVLVTEGLACHFETELRQGAIPFYAKALDEAALKRGFAQAKPVLRNESFNYPQWFFGSPENNIARFTGYSLGYALVDCYILNHGVKASMLCDVPAADFYSDAGVRSFFS